MCSPTNKGFFFVPADISFEMNFVSSDQGNLSDPMRLSDPGVHHPQIASRHPFHSSLWRGRSQPLDVVSEKPPFPTIDLKTFDVRTKTLHPTKDLPTCLSSG
jgi:hypothetical protein